mmetsp:Transcript_20894/g.52802  ORF Transcript_20894/g.52802 Transcript_20894/m.52802 type:complete len:411 (-) Transcript_20894:276-1508(-)
MGRILSWAAELQHLLDTACGTLLASPLLGTGAGGKRSCTRGCGSSTSAAPPSSNTSIQFAAQLKRTFFFFKEEQDPSLPGPNPEGTGPEAIACPEDGSPCAIGCPTKACVETQYCPQDDPAFKDALKNCPRNGCPRAGCVKDAPGRLPYQLRPCSQTGLDLQGQKYQNFARGAKYCDDPKHPNNTICLAALPNDWCKWSLSQKPGGLRIGWSEKTGGDGGKFYTYDKDENQEIYTDKPTNLQIRSAKDAEDRAADAFWQRTNGKTRQPFIKQAVTQWENRTTEVRSSNEKNLSDRIADFGYHAKALAFGANENNVDPNYQKNETCCTTDDNFCKEVEGVPMCVTLEQYRNYLQSGQNLFLTCSSTRDHLNTGCWRSNDLAYEYFGGKSGTVPGFVTVDIRKSAVAGTKLA